MTTRVNYDDNIFFIQTMIKTLDSGIQLTIDGDLFREKLIEDIFYIDSTLSRVLSQLRENRLLIRRTEYLRALMRAETLFLDLLNKSLDEKLPFSAELSHVAHKLRACRSTHQQDLEDIRSILHESSHSDLEEDVVSQEEFRSLLQNDEEDEEENGNDSQSTS
jgi:hypothetical protein